MPSIPESMGRYEHIGDIPEGPQGTPGDSTNVLDGDYRNAPGADHFWHQNRLGAGTDIDPPVN